MDTPLSKIKDRAISIVKEAGETLKKYFYSGEFTSHSKGGVDFATQADDEIDAFLRERLSKELPKSLFLTEESAPKDYSSLKTAENIWIIDPIDGTTNFSRKDPHCAISVALVSKGITRLGIVFAPIENRLYSATASEENAFLNGQELQVSSVSSLKEALVQTDWPWDMQKRQEVYQMLGSVFSHVRAIKGKGSAALDVANLAAGGLDAYFITGIKPWDIAAASLFVKKAGGKITKWDGTTWNVFDDQLLVTNTHLHDAMLKLLQKN